MSQTYDPSELEQFLLAVDKHLQSPAEVVLIGGTALALYYGSTRATQDIDLYSRVGDDLKAAIRSASEETGLRIPVNPTSVVDAPLDYADRLLCYSLRTARKLKIRVPEKHDLALMKLGRGDQNDHDAVVDLHGRVGLEYETLVQRYAAEMGDLPGSLWKRDMAFLAAVEALFGSVRADEAEKQIRAMKT